MSFIWAQNGLFLKDILEMDDYHNKSNTGVATLLRRLIDRGFLRYEMIGKSRCYFPVVQKKEYFKNYINKIIDEFYFGNKKEFLDHINED
ncbi:TPA: BlaI/MecI/CopY family transcriptional regulator [Elizabethkingia anophelis]|nr:BlaI/MecI/CopY family transcriptional regulator [Elizabethkingia anophelis]